MGRLHRELPWTLQTNFCHLMTKYFLKTIAGWALNIKQLI